MDSDNMDYNYDIRNSVSKPHWHYMDHDNMDFNHDIIVCQKTIEHSIYGLNGSW